MITVSSILITCLAKLLVLSSLYLSRFSLVGDSERSSGTRGHIYLHGPNKNFELLLGNKCCLQVINRNSIDIRVQTYNISKGIMRKCKRRLGDLSSWTLLIIKHLSWTCVSIQHLEFLIVEAKMFKENKWDEKGKFIYNVVYDMYWVIRHAKKWHDWFRSGIIALFSLWAILSCHLS